MESHHPDPARIHSPQPPDVAGNSTPAPTRPTTAAPSGADRCRPPASPDTRPCSARWSIKPARVRARRGDTIRLRSPTVPCDSVRQTDTYRPRLSRPTLPAADPKGIRWSAPTLCVLPALVRRRAAPDLHGLCTSLPAIAYPLACALTRVLDWGHRLKLKLKLKWMELAVRVAEVGC